MTSFFSGAGNGSNCFELYDKKRLQCDIQLIAKSIDEMINVTGQKLNYWLNTTTLSTADMLYGEDTVSKYTGPTLIKMRVELNESALAFSKFGFNADDEVTLFVTYNSFNKSFSANDYFVTNFLSVEPKAGDVFEMVEYGLDRVNGRSGNYFQITERRDQDIGGDLNPLGGHYGWRLKAKRLEYSWQPNLPQENENNQFTEDTEYGILSSAIIGDYNRNTLYWYSSSIDSSWFALSNWYTDINHTINSDIIPNNTHNVILLSSYGPVIDLDNYSWIKPNSISAVDIAEIKTISEFNRKLKSKESENKKSYEFSADSYGKEFIIDSTKNDTDVYGTYDLG